jgi:serine protease Do
MIRKMHFNTTAFLVLLGSAVSTFSQIASPPLQTKPVRPPSAPAVEGRSIAPQVVTVVHRLNGLKMFRLLLRNQQEVEAIANLDDAFNLMEDVHTNVIAGLALEDGQTVAAWLPEAEVEFPNITFSFPNRPRATTADASGFGFNNAFFESPDLTVIDSDGKKMSAEFVGVDGATGLSILKISGRTVASTPVIAVEPIKVGEDIRLLGPEPVARPRKNAPSNLYVRMGEAFGTISTVTQAPSGEVARFKIRSPRLLSLVNVGGIAINSTGGTVGIVDSVDGSEASILPAALIHRAVRRVLASKASVPKPWLGVRGEAVAALKAEQMQKLGWELLNASRLAQEHRGILLTWVAPDSPAAFAALRAGDVILRVNDEEIQSAADFSWYLEQAGPTTSVEFTVARPNRITQEAVSVKLSRSPANLFTRNLIAQASSPKERWLIAQGVETIALRPAVAARLGATSGLLIVFVEPSTPAFDAGLQPGDVIQTINGRPALPSNGPMSLGPANTAASTLEIVRKRQKMLVALPKPAKN